MLGEASPLIPACELKFVFIAFTNGTVIPVADPEGAPVRPQQNLIGYVLFCFVLNQNALKKKKAQTARGSIKSRQSFQGP